MNKAYSAAEVLQFLVMTGETCVLRGWLGVAKPEYSRQDLEGKDLDWLHCAGDSNPLHRDHEATAAAGTSITMACMLVGGHPKALSGRRHTV
jgi:hypothetical protein